MSQRLQLEWNKWLEMARISLLGLYVWSLFSSLWGVWWEWKVQYGSLTQVQCWAGVAKTVEVWPACLSLSLPPQVVSWLVAVLTQSLVSSKERVPWENMPISIGRSHKISHDWVLKVTGCHFCHILLVQQVTKAIQIQGEGRKRFHLLMRKWYERIWTERIPFLW